MFVVLLSGYIQLTSLLIDFGATTALLDSKGSLYTSPEFEGARVLIEGHRNEHTQAVMKLVSDKSRKAPFLLIKIWVVSDRLCLFYVRVSFYK
jgi:hypothetical protein